MRLLAIRTVGFCGYFLVLFASLLQAADSCFSIHGRAHLYGDGQLRVWHIGTQHDFEPDASSWNKVESWLEAGVEDSAKSRVATPAASSVYLFADFLIGPTEPFKKGSVQRAKIISAQHRRYVPVR